MGRSVLAAGLGRPAMVIVDTDTGETTPVLSPMDESYAFDKALARDGWVAAQIGYQVAAYRNGGLLRPAMLPAAWEIFPAVEPDCILMRLNLSEIPAAARDRSVAVVDGDGNIRRSGLFPAGAGSGEVDGGVIGRNGAAVTSGHGIWSWADHAFTPLEGTPAGVIGGHTIILVRPGEVEALDTRTGTPRDELAVGNLDSCAVEIDSY